jgi:hypothetical protein
MALGVTGWTACREEVLNRTFGAYVTAIVRSMVAYRGLDFVVETGVEGDLDAIAALDNEPGNWWSNRIAQDSTAASSPALMQITTRSLEGGGG